MKGLTPVGMYLHGFGVAWFQIWETLGIWASEPVGKRVSHMGYGALHRPA